LGTLRFDARWFLSGTRFFAPLGSGLEPPSQIRSPAVRSLFAYWDRIRAGRIAPSWSEIEPGEIKSLLPYLIVAEILDSPFDIRYRLIGMAVVEAFGFDFMGKTLSSLERDSGAPSWFPVYRQFLARRGPCFGQYKIPLGVSQFDLVDAAAFPLSDDGNTINRFIELVDWPFLSGFGPAAWHRTPQNFTVIQSENLL
jgi:hypothetical protein